MRKVVVWGRGPRAAQRADSPSCFSVKIDVGYIPYGNPPSGEHLRKWWAVSGSVSGHPRSWTADRGDPSNRMRFEMDKNDQDNHANQLNPNNDSYWQSRGEEDRPEDWEDRSEDDG